MKLCKDCKHRTENDECHAPQNMEVDAVTGERKVSTWKACRAQRVGGPIADFFVSVGFCGWRAKWFEPK